MTELIDGSNAGTLFLLLRHLALLFTALEWFTTRVKILSKFLFSRASSQRIISNVVSKRRRHSNRETQKVFGGRSRGSSLMNSRSNRSHQLAHPALVYGRHLQAKSLPVIPTIGVVRFFEPTPVLLSHRVVEKNVFTHRGREQGFGSVHGRSVDEYRVIQHIHGGHCALRIPTCLYLEFWK